MHAQALAAAPARTRAIQRTLGAILVLNAAVVAVKLVVGIRTSSLTVIGATLESFLDATNNVLAMIVIGLAARGPDEDHPYGHDKFETMGAIGIVGFLSISCFELVRGGFSRLLGGGPVATAPDGLHLALLGATAVVNVGVVWFERRRARALASPLLAADAAHTAGDLFVTGLAFASLVAVKYGVGWADPALAIVVALVIAWSGVLILRMTVPVLVDARGADAERIRGAALAVTGVTGAPSGASRTRRLGLTFGGGGGPE